MIMSSEMPDQKLFVLILGGGAGTRFWPASREHLPKQFLDITGSGKSLIRQTTDRFLSFVPKENIFVITHHQYAALVAKEIPELSDSQIITEPTRNNTAAAIAYSSFKLHALDPDALCIVAPADHVITNETAFYNVIAKGCNHAANHNSLITLGINPSRPDTGYGYIQFESDPHNEIFEVVSFREKPDLKTAASYLETGNYVWNAGIFIWSLRAILAAFEKHATSIYSDLQAGQSLYNTDKEKEFIDRIYPGTESISVDYAILERATDVYTIPCEIGWSDLGTWNSLYDFLPKDQQQNAIAGKSNFLIQSDSNIISADDKKLVVIQGLSDYIVVDTPDCLMIIPRSNEQEIKQLKEQLKEKGFDKFV